MRSPVPPLNPLHVFAVASRLGSFTEAAEELDVSQSAVSRQIAVLEAFLGTRLFTRERHGIVLTAAGEGYRAAVAPAFEQIRSATEQVRREGRDEPLRLRVYNVVAVKWLLPRLHRFRARHPAIAVRMINAVAPVDFRREAVDLAIQLGDGNWPGLRSRRLLPDILQPVCSPRLLRKGPPLRTPGDLRRHQMLVSRYRRDDWRDWLAAAGHAGMFGNGMEFASSVLTFQAAIEGLGVAIGQMPLLAADVEAGLLVPRFGPVERPLGYHVVWPADRAPDRKARAFLAWLLEEAG